MQKVLVAFDGSESSIRALRFVVEQPKAARPSELHLLNVQDYPIVISEYVTSSMIEAIRRGQTEHSREVLARGVALLESSGIPHHEHVVIGFPGTAITEQAAALGCGQIVMGTRGLGMVKGLVLGSVAQRVIHLSPVPVTLVK
ncbi:nucleotide-binding universal stress UspA family protein [Panacagrimonas perspica]|uniref:Nucleotide-binding universal stress UspA family protein n=1 Tax=Panacagrimonas perspica TaxID=381431 RepID=A0A4V3URK1_9GAMM|nr:universal stress protein [Panacagrimonas perspica]TDU31673.1 nucleotide-binding universal stress UspA family protein [Panacagrimonas perspica]THD03111.1 hypothetical protein B1810_10990 [Panacagrimonas perspica]